MDIAKIQNELKNNGVTYRGYELLQYLKKTYFQDFKGVELQRLRPLAFGESKYVKQGFEELINAKVISGEYKNGVAKNIIPNLPILNSLDNIGEVVTVVKDKTPKVKKEKIVPEVVKDIFKHYNSYPALPRPSTMTPLAIDRTVEKLKVYTPEQVKEGISVASEAKWLINKGSEPWCNYAWVINVIEEFMEGGKYASTMTPTTATSKYATMAEENVEIFW